MLFEIMKHIRNFFPTGEYKEGAFKIEDGTIILPFVRNGQYIYIQGSKFNDGVYKYPATDLEDEEFDGCIDVLAPPREFLALCCSIEMWVKTNGDRSAMQSESFGGYSYTRATNADGSLADWQDVYRQRLNAWRKI